ncbi:period circadian protein homolog 2 [Hemiscyllium ocellatum]|uniref:period circadian protein homolog 2 n=1 Tax=Hemiscyllium ocellatum TaxID=170820 RepID=UPI002966CE07|nr:period circadian protein homolog 2 [Hemiscyllium ocellatum]
MATFSESGFQEAELVLHSSSADIQDQTQDREVQQLHDDVEMKSNGSSGTDSNVNEFSESSSSSASQNGKDSALLLDSLESSKSTNTKKRKRRFDEVYIRNKRRPFMPLSFEKCNPTDSSNSQSLSLRSSSNGFSLISASSEQDNPSTSGCSSDQSAKAKTQKELIKALSVLKRHLPSDKMTKGKSRTLSTLKYALRCVKQVRANEEYYKFRMNDNSEPSSLSINSFTIDEVENITSEYTLKNTDIFAVTVSLITGQIVYISDQASSVLNCNKDVFKNVKFTELLAPQDVGVFYSFTKPSQLPLWSVCTAADSSPPDCMQEKSFFCRISGDRQRGHSIHYYPFRMTTYLTKVRLSEDDDDQLCCLLLAERVHSGYEAPRIPHDKRVFTTTHTPSCVFQDVDERAVPLLGYLPQDLIGMPVLMHLHPDDQPLMLGIHKKILKHAGQPFEHSPLRFCSQNGEYITIDTSWSSFVNPWSRKVSFIIGRHKVRTGPLNEDVFANPGITETKTLSPEIQTITEQIRQLLLQPVYNNGSSGYGSLGSNGSHAQFMSVASSSDSSGNINEESHWNKPMTFQKICKDVHLVKNQGQAMFIENRGKSESKRRHKSVTQQKETCGQSKDFKASSSKGAAPSNAVKNMLSDDTRCKEQPVYCYQQINCLDSVIRYLDSYNIPSSVKRKCESSSASDDDKEKNNIQVSKEAPPLPQQSVRVPFKVAKEVSTGTVVGTSLTPLSLPRKAASVTSQCSYSSTIVHVGDKKLQADAEILLEDGLGTTDSAENMTSTTLVTAVPSVSQEKEPYKKLGLTKEVLAAHTQKEEQIFLSKFKELSKLKTIETSCKSYLEDQYKGCSGDCGSQGFKPGWNHAEPVYKKGGKNKKLKSKRIKQQELSDSAPSHTNHHTPSSWSPSTVSQSRYSALPFTTVLPPCQLPVFSPRGGMPPTTDPSLSSFENAQGVHCTTQPPAYSAPLVTPMVAFVLPNYMLPQMNDSVHQPFFASQAPFPSQSAFLPQTPFPAQTSFQSQPQFASQHYDPPGEGEKAAAPESRGAPSCCCTPQSVGPQGHSSPPLFQSRCSSPLQLNLLQLEEMPKSSEGIAVVGLVGGSGSMVDGGGMNNTPNIANVDIVKDEAELAVSPDEPQNSDAHSTSTDLLDLLLQDSLSGTGSAGSGSARSTASGSSGSPSNGCGMSGTDTGSSHLSNTSKYFGSIDSSENDHKSKLGNSKKTDHLANCVLQDPVWLSMANIDERTMMTYQLPSRDIETVLKEDREKLKMMQRNQPKFTEDQKKELYEVFPWFKTNILLKTFDNTDLACWGKNASQSNSTIFDAEIHNLELNGLMEPSHNVGYPPLNFPIEEQKRAEIATSNLAVATTTFGNSAS